MNPSRKIGVLTFHRCINYGSYWQARCLVEGLRARGHDAVILDHDSRSINLAEWKCGLQPVLPTPVSKADSMLYGLKMLKFFRAFSALPRSRRFALERPAEMEPFDLVVVGSDEVWNLRHPWYGGDALFFGTGIRAPHLISYAASFGNYHVSEGLDETWAERLKGFEWISVRDENSRTLIKNALGIEPELVLDPCLQFFPRLEGRPSGPNRPYIAVYGHNFSQGFSQGVGRWARSRGYRLVSIGYRNAWADLQWITAGPHDFLHAMAGARAVVTNFFHGCIFALGNAKPFVCEHSAYRSTKVQDLMAAVGGEKALVSQEAPDSAYEAALGEPLSSEIFHRIGLLRQASETYLDQALV